MSRTPASSASGAFSASTRFHFRRCSSVDSSSGRMKSSTHPRGHARLGADVDPEAFGFHQRAVAAVEAAHACSPISWRSRSTSESSSTLPARSPGVRRRRPYDALSRADGCRWLPRPRCCRLPMSCRVAGDGVEPDLLATSMSPVRTGRDLTKIGSSVRLLREREIWVHVRFLFAGVSRFCQAFQRVAIICFPQPEPSTIRATATAVSARG